jgi:hypothetical protein
VLVLPRSLQFLGNYKLKTKSLTTNFTNKTANDIILKEFNDMLGKNFNTLTDEKKGGLRKPQD